MRWRQDRDTGKLIPIDESARRADGGHYVQGDIESFVSPVDGTVITDRRQLRLHNERNNVVNSAEFSPEFLAKKAKERADFYEGRHSSKEKLKRRQEIYENWVGAERQHNN